jgi:hypothetical protein
MNSFHERRSEQDEQKDACQPRQTDPDPLHQSLPSFDMAPM